MFKKLNNIGDCGIVCDFGDEVNREINSNVIKLFHHVKKEVLKGTQFSYLPLLKVTLMYLQKKGIFKKTIIEIPENLYLDYKTERLLYVHNNKITFKSVVDLQPHKIRDLDDHCKIESISKAKVDYDFRGLGGKKLNKMVIRNIMERKYPVKVKEVELLLFPTWVCTLADKNNKTSRSIILDGVLGEEIVK